MKTSTLKALAIVLFISVTNVTQAQILDVIDKIAGVLIPSISTSVKQIIDEKGRNNQKESAKADVDTKIKEAQRLLVNDLNKEITNIALVRKVFSITRKMNTSIGGLELLTDRNFITHIVETDAIETKRRIAISYSLYYKDIQSLFADLKAIDVNSLDPNLLTTLTQEKESIEKAINKINGINGFSGGELTFEDNITIPQAKNKIRAIDLSSEYVEDIKDSVEKIALLIDTRLKSYELAFTELKVKFQ